MLPKPALSGPPRPSIVAPSFIIRGRTAADISIIYVWFAGEDGSRLM